MAAGDLDLLLSLDEDSVLDSPPISPASLRHHQHGYGSDDGSTRAATFRPVDLSVFRDVVKDCLEEVPTADPKAQSNRKPKKGQAEPGVEQFSGLRIRNSLVSHAELTERFFDNRFVRLSSVRNMLHGDTLTGCWATVGVLTETGAARSTSAGKGYCVWKLSCLDESNVSVFLFNDAYTRNSKESIGTIFALFNSSVRKESMGTGFSLSVYSSAQILKIGTSVDYGVCKGKRKDGLACTIVINKSKGMYCKFHSSSTSQKYNTKRAELMGGNIRRSFRNPMEGVYMVDPSERRSNAQKSAQSVKVISVDGLKRALSKANKVTTNSQSQGLRFLSQLAGGTEPKPPQGLKNLNQKRSSAAVNPSAKTSTKEIQPDAKRPKAGHISPNMIELDFVSSDEDGRC